jgi:antibiotic biosynthesis monooxygenase (ABM) superfamily enzyme
MLTPPPGSKVGEYGVLRTFRNEEERDAFYKSPMFKAWEDRARTLTEGEPVYRQLHGLEAWFRSPHNPPPRWKMAAATFLGVFPVALILNLTLGPVIRPWHFILRNAVFNVCVVALLTWVVMPIIARLLKGWLNPQPQKKERTT